MLDSGMLTVIGWAAVLGMSYGGVKQALNGTKETVARIDRRTHNQSRSLVRIEGHLGLDPLPQEE